MHDQEIDKAWNVWLLKKRVGFKNFDIKYFIVAMSWVVLKHKYRGLEFLRKKKYTRPALLAPNSDAEFKGN